MAEPVKWHSSLHICAHSAKGDYPKFHCRGNAFLLTCSKRLLLIVSRAWFVHMFVCLLGDDVHLERLYSHWQTQRLNWRHAENTGWGTGSTWKSTKYVNPLSTFPKIILIEINAILQKLIHVFCLVPTFRNGVLHRWSVFAEPPEGTVSQTLGSQWGGRALLYPRPLQVRPFPQSLSVVFWWKQVDIWFLFSSSVKVRSSMTTTWSPMPCWNTVCCVCSKAEKMTLSNC